MLKRGIIFLFYLNFLNSVAQIPCVEESRIQPLFSCNDRQFEPVCGCNNVTYRNQCNAYNNHGVNNFRSGVCSGLFIDVLPNPISNASQLQIGMAFEENMFSNVDVKIIDIYGKVWDQKIINNFNKTDINLDISTLKTGVYILIFQSNNNFITYKFSKY